MVKKSSSKRLIALGQVVTKYKIRSRAANQDKESRADLIDFGKDYVFGKIKYSHLFRMSQSWFHYITDQSTRLGLAPFQRTHDNNFVRLPWRRLLVHYGAIFILTVLMIFRLCATIKFVRDQDSLTVETFMCVNFFLVSFVPWCMSLALVYKPTESITLLNSWTPYMGCIGRKPDNVVGRTSTALNVITLVLVTHTVAIMMSLFSLIFNDLPVCAFTAMENLGLVPNLPLPRIVRQLIFFPLELLLNIMSEYHAALSGQILCIGHDIHTVALFEMRKVSFTAMLGRLRLEKMYMQLEIYNGIFANWVTTMIAPTLFGVGCAIVIDLYITIRHTELPWFVYAGFPYTSVNLLIIMFWICYNGITNIRDSEAILVDLQSLSAPCLAGLSLPRRKNLIKKAKVFRQISFPMGPVDNFSLMIPLGVWEEVLNQLLFLLSL